MLRTQRVNLVVSYFHFIFIFIYFFYFQNLELGLVMTSLGRLKNLNIPVSFLFFVDNRLIIAQNKSFDISNSHLYCSYNVLSKLLDSFGLIIKCSKTEIFHFSRSQGLFNPPPLDLSLLGGPILRPKDSQKYLGFIFDRKLSFHKHIDFYANKAMSTVKCMKLLGNSS